jgi:hypothetical protein
MCQRPPVERTMESPMARPRPAPPWLVLLEGAVRLAGAAGLVGLVGLVAGASGVTWWKRSKR